MGSASHVRLGVSRGVDGADVPALSAIGKSRTNRGPVLVVLVANVGLRFR